MTHAHHDMWLLFTPGMFEKIKDSRGSMVLQKNGALKIRNTVFFPGKTELSRRYDSRTLRKVTENIPFMFSGAHITFQKGGSEWMPPHLCHDYSPLQLNLSFAMSMSCHVRVEHTLHLYAHQNSSFAFSIAAKYFHPSVEHARALNRAIKSRIQDVQLVLSFVRLDISNLYATDFVDDTFANNDDYTSLLGLRLFWRMKKVL